MLNEIAKTDAGFKKRGMNFTLVIEALAHNTRNILVEGKMMRSWPQDPLKPYNLHF